MFFFLQFAEECAASFIHRQGSIDQKPEGSCSLVINHIVLQMKAMIAIKLQNRIISITGRAATSRNLSLLEGDNNNKRNGVQVEPRFTSYSKSVSSVLKQQPKQNAVLSNSLYNRNSFYNGVGENRHQQRWFSNAGDNGTNEDIDRSKFTQEIKVLMPDMGEGEGEVLEWYKKEGDLIQRDDVLCDIETPDFTFGLVTDDQHDAILGKIHVEAKSGPVRDEALICTLLHKEGEESEVGTANDDEEKKD